MKKFIFAWALLLASFAAFAQESRIPAMVEIAQVEDENGDAIADVFFIERNGQTHYYLDLGNLAMGDEVVQIQFDPLFRLYIPLGTTLTEALENMQMLQKRYKSTPKSSIEVTGNFAVFPTERLETVTVTTRKAILGRNLEFSLEREGYIRATYISKSDFNSLVASLKFYRKLHKSVE